MASPETREVVRSALRKVPCFINLDDEKKFSYVCHRLRRLHSAPGETVISEGEQGSTVYILLEGTMECFVAGVKVAEISEGTVVGERAMLTNAARSATVVAATACVSWVLERRHARYLMKEADGVWRRVLALESLSIPSPDDNSIMPSGLEGIITQKLDALSLNATTFAKLASAFGAVFHKEALRTCFPGPKDSGNDDAIDELVKAQLIVADSHGTDTQNTRAAQRLAWSQRIAEERGDLGGSVYGGGRASNYGDDFRSVAGDDLRSIAGDRMSCRGSVVGGDSSDVGSTETRLRSNSNEEVDHEDLLEKFRASERAKRLNKRPAGLYRFRNQQIAEVIYGVVPDEQKREYHRRIAEFFEDCLCVLEGRECITHVDERRAIDTVVAALKLTTKDLHLLLADHSTKSRSLDSKAKEYSLLAARDATALGLYREAEQHYRRVVSMEQPSFVEEEVGKLSLAKAARLSAFLGLAELYARFELAPRPRDVDREQAPLGEGPIPLLTRGLEMLGVDSDELAEADFSAGNIAKNEADLPNEELDLLARALNQLGWCLMRSGVALESRRRCRLTEGCFAHAVRIAKKRNDLPFAASALNGFGTFYQNCAQRVGREKNKRLCDVVLGDKRTPLRKPPSLKKQVSAKKFVKYQKVPPPQSGRCDLRVP